MKIEDLKKGETYFLASIEFTDKNADVLRVRELVLTQIGKAFVTLEGPRFRLKWHIPSNRGGIDSLQTSPAMAVSWLRNRIVQEIDYRRKSMKRREEEFEERQKLISKWFNDHGL